MMCGVGQSPASRTPTTGKWFRRWYNVVRPHSSSGYATPEE
jgi:hypothetical protein